MLEKMTQFAINKFVESKLKKYDIKLLHFIPGRIRLQSPRWVNNSGFIEKIAAELKMQPMIYTVQPTIITGSLLITYDAQFAANAQEMESWFAILDRIYAAEDTFKTKGC